MDNQQSNASDGLQLPGLVQSEDPVEQLSFPGDPITPLPTSTPYQQGPQSSPDLADQDTVQQPAHKIEVANPQTPSPVSQPGTTRALLWQAQPAVTRALTNAVSQPGTTSLRPPMVIHGSGRKTSIRPPQGRRHVIGIAAVLLLVVITTGTLLAASPLGHEGALGAINPLAWGSNGTMVQDNSNPNSLQIAQQATATAVVHQQTDGYDPSTSTDSDSGSGGGGGASLVTGASSTSAGSPTTWPVGVCTYWANEYYHQLSGHWVTWLGNAYQWADGAAAAGWVVSSTPKVPSIIVLQPGVQGASDYGHVAVVTGISGNVVHTSNMNWYTNGGGFDIVSEADFVVGPGVSFIWY
jgi:surface antigen